MELDEKVAGNMYKDLILRGMPGKLARMGPNILGRLFTLDTPLSTLEIFGGEDPLEVATIGRDALDYLVGVEIMVDKHRYEPYLYSLTDSGRKFSEKYLSSE